MIELEYLKEFFNPEFFLATGGFVLNLLIVPTIMDEDAAVPRLQSVLSAIVLLFCFAVPYYWIGFYWSAFANMTGVVLWSIVALYRYPSEHKKVVEDSQISKVQNQVNDYVGSD